MRRRVCPGGSTIAAAARLRFGPRPPQSCMSIRLHVLTVVLLGFGRVAVAQPDLSQVHEVVAPGTPGQMTVWGTGAHVLVAGGDDQLLVPVVACAEVSDREKTAWGRIVAFAHTGFLDDGSMSVGDTGTLIAECLRWAAHAEQGKGPQPRVACINCDLTKFIQARGMTAEEVKGRDWESKLSRADVDVVCLVGNNLSDGQVDALAAFVNAGGGLMLAQTAWAWRDTGREGILENPLNRICSKVQAGLAWTRATSDKTGKVGFLVPAAAAGQEPPLLLAGPALEALVKGGAGKPDARLKQAAMTLVNAARHLPPDDRLLRPQLQGLLAEHAAELAPTAKSPLKQEQALARALLAFQVAELATLRAEEIRAHPAAASFPGAVPPPSEAPRSTAARLVTIDTAVSDWHSTGLYAAPGEVITVTAPKAATGAKKPIEVRIGGHKDALWHHAKWERVPEITRSWAIAAEHTTVASPFGGAIYLDVPKSCDLGTLTVSIAGAVEAPMFVLGQTTPEQWKSIRTAPAPWAELCTRKVIISVPSSAIRTLEDPATLMRQWDLILDAAADLATIPRERARPERYTPDQQISAGYMHSGYPIMTHLDAVGDMTNPEKLGLNHKGGSWGLFHELGHNHQASEWTFDGTGEVTVNLFSLYIMETVCGQAMNAGHGALEKRAELVGQFLDDRPGKRQGGPRSFERWKSDAFLSLIMYQQLREAFGWDTYKKVFAEYRAMPNNLRPKHNDAERDQWMVRFSRGCGRNLGPFFEAWGVPTSAAARESIKDLPVWMPEDWPGPMAGASSGQ